MWSVLQTWSRRFLVALLMCGPATAWAVGESSTRFNTYVPASNLQAYNYWIGLHITASGAGHDGSTTVSVWDMPADNCARGQCDPYGLLDSGTDGAVSGNQFSSTSASFADPQDAANAELENAAYPFHRYIVIRSLADASLDAVYRISGYVNATTVTLEGTPAAGSGLTWVLAQAGDVDDSFSDVVLQRGETFSVFIKDSNRCITSSVAADCYSFNSTNPRGEPLTKEELLDFFARLSPSANQLAALKASLLTYPVLPVVDDGLPTSCATDADCPSVHMRDGDYFIIQASSPVVTYTAAKSNWEHDTAVADTKNGLGQSFYLFAPPYATPVTDTAGTGGNRDIDVFAYEDDTWVTVYRTSVEDESQNNACPTCICQSATNCRANVAEASFASATRLTFPYQSGALQRGEYDHFELDAGQSLNIWNRTIAHYEEINGGNTSMRDQGIALLSEGHSYYVSATKPVTVMFGMLQSWTRPLDRRCRDGGGAVPSQNGTSSGELYYFTIPAGISDGNVSERELRIVSFDDANEVCLDGWDPVALQWMPVPFGGRVQSDPCVLAAQNERIDLTGQDHVPDAGNTPGGACVVSADCASATGCAGGCACVEGSCRQLVAMTDSHPFRALDLFRLTCSPGKKVGVAEANWMETGGISTSDMASFISPQNIADETAELMRFLVYMAPPGTESYVMGVGRPASSAGSYGHVFVFADNDNTGVVIRPTDVVGQVPLACRDEFPDDGATTRRVTIDRDGFFDLRMDAACYNALNQPEDGLRPYLEVMADSTVSVLMSNYNDNWLNFSTSLLPATPALSLRPDAALLSIATDTPDRFARTHVVLKSRHIFPVFRTNSIYDPRIEIIVPDGLTLVSDPVVTGLRPMDIEAGGLVINVDTSDAEGRTFIEVTGFMHRAFATVTVSFDVQVAEAFHDGSEIAWTAEDQVVLLASEEGNVAGTNMAGYSSAAVRIFRCAFGDPTSDPDGDGQCSGSGACHTVGSAEICAGADLCPLHFSTPGRCPFGYVCEPWGVCYHDPDVPDCSSNLSGGCGVAADEIDEGLTCTPTGCVLIGPGEGCEEGGTLCTDGRACVAGVCVPLDGQGGEHPACTLDTDSSGTCSNGFSCVNGTCVDASADACEAGGSLCPHGMACVDEACLEITPGTECTLLGGLCPHREACVSGICTPYDTSNECGETNPLGFCPHDEACVDGQCLPYDPDQACSCSARDGVCHQGAGCVCPAEGEACSELTCGCETTVVPCSAGNPEGECPADMVCTTTGCRYACSESRPTGWCEAPGVCALGSCQTACDAEHPSGACVETGAECIEGSCRYRCSPTHADGYCETGECLDHECRARCGTSAPMGWCPTTYDCNGLDCVHLCGAAFPDGWCPTGEVCIDEACGVAPDGGLPDGGQPDGGGPPGDADGQGTVLVQGGCGCAAGAQGVGWLVVAALLLRRRRR